MAVYLARSDYNLQLRIKEVRTEETRLIEDMYNFKRIRDQGGEEDMWCYGTSNKEEDHDSEAKKLLMSCTSRRDFLIREGPRIAWCELPTTSESSKGMAIYLPSGKHRLTYAMSHVPRKEHYNSPLSRPLPERKTLFEFPRGEEVYEFTVAAGKSRNFIFRIQGENDHILLEQVFNQSPGGVNSFKLTVPSRPFSYPSQLKFYNYGDEGINSFRENGATYLGDFQGPYSKRIHLWIESEGPLCMSAIEVAGKYTEALRWLNHREHGNSIVKELNEVFYPYDGSDRFYLRSPTVKVPRNR